MRELMVADQRLVLLRALAEMPGYEANESILHALLQDFGHQVSRDQVRTHLAWLDETGLITLRIVTSVQIARLTERGFDVGSGRAAVPGVKRPSPR